MLLNNKTFYYYFVILWKQENIKIFTNAVLLVFGEKNTTFLDKNFDFINNNRFRKGNHNLGVGGQDPPLLPIIECVLLSFIIPSKRTNIHLCH